MKLLDFADLIRLPIIEHYERAFRKATGVALKVVPPGEPTARLTLGKDESPLCALLTSSPTGCEACLEIQRRAQRTVGKKAAAHQMTCFAGLTDVAVPVFCGGRHVATLMSGQVFRREPTERDFQMVVKMIGAEKDAAWEKRLRQAYFEAPVADPERFEAIIQLLTVFAQYIGEHASRHAMACAVEEPPAVASAKQFVQEHVEDRLTLAQVVQHVNSSRFYFCKLFKKATGMTLTEYISHIRVEKAKSLLVNPSLRVSEIVFASGFGSIPQFNSVFKRLVGIPPTEYRERLRSSSKL